MWDYTEKVKSHFEKPHNVGEVKDPDAVGEVGSLVCGDALRLTLKIESKTERILEAKFLTFGCGSAIASSSVLTDMIVGKTLDEAARISNRDIAEALGGLPREKMHCSVMGQEALEAAIADYRGEKPGAAHEEDEGAIVCQCFGVTDKKIERAVLENGLTTLEEVTNYTKAGGACGACHWKIEEILREAKSRLAACRPPEARQPLTNLERIRRVEETLEREVRPELQKDGGDIELVDVEGQTVKVRLLGMCSGCQVANFTLRDVVGQKLREFVEPDIRIEEIKT